MPSVKVHLVEVHSAADMAIVLADFRWTDAREQVDYVGAQELTYTVDAWAGAALVWTAPTIEPGLVADVQRRYFAFGGGRGTRR